ncbi:hypothetical protein OG474_27715 [Kribbella sp. NBC_01505]|uniref:hypothetical protein n=1 Tax=Kribbella sp. NBC_01505 TaxID=2903580 RepID=UPI003868C491
MSQQYPQDPNRPFDAQGLPPYGAPGQQPSPALGHPQYPAGGPAPRGPKQHKPRSRAATIGWSALGGLIIFTVGAVAGNAGADTTSAAALSSGVPAPTVTVTTAAKPGEEVTVTAPPVTVTKPAPPAKTVTAQPPQASAAITDDGTYEVGVDIKPGKYKSAGGGDCYWARMSSLDGDLGGIIANNLSSGPQTVVIKKSDKAFKTERCGEWRKTG